MEIRTDKMLSSDQRREMLKRIMDHYGMFTQAEFARKLGISVQNINSWLSRGAYNVELLAVTFPELSGDWLLTGEEPMLKKDRAAKTSETYHQLPAGDAALMRAMETIATEQRMAVKAQEQTDKLLSIMQSLAVSLKRLKKGSE